MKLSTTLSLVAGCVLALGTSSAFGNLVTNGDFEQGGVGFGTQYQIAFSNTSEGQLTVTSSPNSWNTSFATPTPSGYGQSLVANGSTNVFDRIWFTSLDVVKDAVYQVSFEGVSLSASSPAKLRFYAALDPTDPIAAVKVDELDLNSGSTWQQSNGGSFTATNTGTITLFLANLTTATGGNDFAIDNITVVPEPSTLALLGLGSLIGLGVFVRRRRNG